MSRTLGRLPKSLRIRFFSVKEYFMIEIASVYPCQGSSTQIQQQKQREQAGDHGSQPVPSKSPQRENDLFDLDSRADFLEFLLDLFSFVLGNSFLDVCGGAFYQILGFLQAQAADFTNNLDHRHFLATK